VAAKLLGRALAGSKYAGPVQKRSGTGIPFPAGTSHCGEEQPFCVTAVETHTVRKSSPRNVSVDK